MFGDVIYGGHVTDAFDRHLLNTYFEQYTCDELLGGFEILPGWHTPTVWDDRFEDMSAFVSVLRVLTFALCRGHGDAGFSLTSQFAHVD